MPTEFDATFNRPPRSWIVLPTDEINAPDPPQFPTEPNRPDFILTVLPAISIAVVSMFGALAINAAGGSNTGVVIALMIMVTVSSVVYPIASYLSYYFAKRKWKRDIPRVESEFQDELETLGGRLDDLQQTQRKLANEIDPSTNVLLTRVRERHPRMWERRPDHNDFLNLRFGLYSGTPTYKIAFHNIRNQNDRYRIQANDRLSRYKTVSKIPCTIRLPDVGSVGIVGSSAYRAELARTLICNIATHHAPSEVYLYLFYDKTNKEADWNWFKWLPHSRATSVQIAGSPEPAQRLLRQITKELEKRERLESNADDSGALLHLPYLVIFVETLDLFDPATFEYLLKRGKGLRTSIIFLADDLRQLPNGCGARLEILNQHAFKFAVDRSDFEPVTGEVEMTPVDMCESMARSLSPLTIDQIGGLPLGLRLSELLGLDPSLDSSRVDLVRLWKEHSSYQTQLTAPIGKSIGNVTFELDLRSTVHGPHGLIAGTTGAGKTVLLSTLLASMAACNSPKLVNFVLVDMKGDPKLSLLKDLPHMVGFASALPGGNLKTREQINNYITRAITALKQEINGRMQKFNEANPPVTGDLFDYNRQFQNDPIPHLVVIIDEFAILRQEFEDLMKAIVDVARTGRQPGVYLILCTQSPAGIVTGQIDANSNFRICLRVANTEESHDVLKRPDAANLPADIRGRAYLKAGGDSNTPLALFQVANACVPLLVSEDQDSADLKFKISEFRDDGTLWQRYPKSIDQDVNVLSEQTELSQIVRLTTRDAIREGISLPLIGPWKPPLEKTIYLDKLIAETTSHRMITDSGWTEPIANKRLCVTLGRLDHPSEPVEFSQPSFEIDFNRIPHIWACGRSDSGVDLFLRTLMVALISSHTPDELHVYIVSYSQQALSPFRSLPHVGAFIEQKEKRRLQLLVNWLKEKIGERQHLLKDSGSDTIFAYRKTNSVPVPSIVVVIDGFDNLQTEADLEIVTDLGRLLSLGSAHDVHFVITTTLPKMTQEMRPHLTGLVAFYSHDEAMYYDFFGTRPPFMIDNVVGRCYWRPEGIISECQIAIPFSVSEDENDNLQTRIIAPQQQFLQFVDRVTELCAKMDIRRYPDRIESLPDKIELEEMFRMFPRAVNMRLEDSHSTALPIALGVAENIPQAVFSLDLVEHRMVMLVDNSKSGKTSTLKLIALLLAARYTPAEVQIYGVDLKSDSAKQIGLLKTIESFQPSLRQFYSSQSVISWISKLQSESQNKTSNVHHVVLIDNADYLIEGNDPLVEKFTELFKNDLPLNWSMVVAGPRMIFEGEPFKALKKHRCGLVFVETASDVSDLVPKASEIVRYTATVPGKAIWVGSGNTQLIQIARLPDDVASLRQHSTRFP